ncbi:MAG: hypothetical protein OXH46_15190 [Gemmatimonadetes bacterium]|nr:hypothetical protein [Gemmatimonadota bacterium]
MKGTLVLAAALGAGGLSAQEVVDLPAEDIPLSADLELEYRIGSATATAEWEQFAAIRNVAFDGAGNLYVLDGAGVAGATHVVVVDAVGRYVRDFGRGGGGPGEFRAPTQLVVWEDGRAVVEDMMRRGYHIFSPDGEFEDTVREPGSGFGIASRPGLRPARTDLRSLIGRSERSIVRIDMSSDELTEQTLVEAWAPRQREESRDREDRAIADVIGEVWGFEPEVLFDVLPSGAIALSDSSGYALKLTDPSGTVSRILRRPLQPQPVTDEMKRSEREHLLEIRRSRRDTWFGTPTPEMIALVNEVKTAWLAAAENMRFFPEVPLIAAVRATWDGTLWVQRSTESGSDEPGLIDVIAPNGRYVGTLAPGTATLPDMPAAFGPDGLVAFIDTDALDVPVITVRRLPPGIR